MIVVNSLSASPRVALNCACASIRPWISSRVWTMNMSTRSSRVPSSRLLKGAARLANSKWREYALQNLLGLIHALPALLGECTKAIPLVTDCLASAIHLSRVPVVQSVELLGNGSNLLDAV